MAIDSVGGRHAEGLFGDLRIRVIGAVEGGLSARGGRGGWGGGIDSDRLGWSVAADGEFGGQVTEGPQPLAAGGACAMVIGADRGGSRSHPGGDRRAVGGARDSGGPVRSGGFTIGTASALKNRTRRRAAPGCGERPAGSPAGRPRRRSGMLRLANCTPRSASWSPGCDPWMAHRRPAAQRPNSWRCLNPKLSRSAIHRCLQRQTLSAPLTRQTTTLSNRHPGRLHPC